MDPNESSSADQVSSMMEAANAGETTEIAVETPTEVTQTSEQQGTSQEDTKQEELGEYGSQFLSDLEDEELRERLTPYIRKWDAGVTRKFQDIHSQYKPYKELGEIEDLYKAQQLFQVINSDPESATKRLAEALGYRLSKAEPQVVDPDDEDQVFENRLRETVAPLQKQLETQQKILQTIAENKQREQEEAHRQQQVQEFQGYLDLLEREKGKFDREYVTALIAQGVEPGKAVEQFQSIIQEQLNANSRPQPPTLNGTGHVPSPNKDVRSLSSKETANLVQSMLNNVQDS